MFAAQVLDAVARIPAGRVMSYGDVAEYVGAGHARAVGQVMWRHGGDVPWHRVVHADGTPKPHGGAEQLALLVADGTPMAGNRVDMTRARWDGR